MSSETERITNEVLNRHPWDGLERRVEKVHFDGAERRESTADESCTTNLGIAGTNEAVLDSPQ